MQRGQAASRQYSRQSTTSSPRAGWCAHLARRARGTGSLVLACLVFHAVHTAIIAKPRLCLTLGLLPVSAKQMQSVLLEVQSAVLSDDTLRDEQRAKACSAVALADKVRHCKPTRMLMQALHT
jgi:hypothetical protein